MIKHLSARVQAFTAARPHLSQALHNVVWLFLDKGLRLILGLVVGIWVARYLGPDQFGLLNFALAFYLILYPLSAVGLETVVIRDLVLNPAGRAQLVATVFAARAATACFAYIAAIGLIVALRPHEVHVHWLVAVVSFAILFQSSEALDYWYQAQVRAKYVVFARNLALLLSSAVKVGLIACAASLLAFAWTTPLEAALGALFLLLVYRRHHASTTFGRPTWPLAKGLLQQSWPLAISSLAMILYMRVDQLMLAQLANNTEVGIYSAALRLSEIYAVIPLVISQSAFARILQLREADRAGYLRSVGKLLNVLFVMALFCAVATSLCAKPLVNFLFGAPYAKASTALLIHVWGNVFVFLGVGAGRWFLAEQLQKLTVHRALLGLVANVALNFLLIPRFGAAGAASASVFSYAVGFYFSNALLAQTRPIFVLQSRAILMLDFFKPR